MPIEQYTYWSMTINNPTENDYVLVRNPNAKYIRELVWTPEEGENEGTPHIQAWVRMQRNVTLTFMKRMFPRGSFKPCDKDGYNENVHQYAQKNDVTTRGPHTIRINDPLPSVERMLPEIYEGVLGYLQKQQPHYSRESLLEAVDYRNAQRDRTIVEGDLVRRHGPLYAKIFVSPIYEKLWAKFGFELFIHWRRTQLEEISQQVDIPTLDAHQDQDSLSRSHREADEESEGDEDYQTEEAFGSSESGSVSSSSSDDLSQSRE